MRRLGTLPSGWLGTIASTDPEDDRPLLLPGVRVKFSIIGRQAVREARTACGIALKSTDGDFQVASDALSRELIRGGIVEWEGIGDRDGNPAAVTPETIDLFIADTDLCEAAEQVYVTPWLMRDREKNVSGVSSNGTSQEETPGSDTATSVAPQAKPENGAAPTSKRARKPAPTGNMSHAPKKANSPSK